MNATIRVSILKCLAVMVAVSTAASASAASFTLIDGEGFDSADYSTGILEGQFASTFEGVGSAAWVQSPLGGTSTAVVQTAVVASGDQAVQVDRAAGSDDRWAVPITGAPAERFVCIEWDMYVVEATSTPDGSFGPLFGIEAYDDDATSLLPIGLFGMDAATGDLLATDTTFGLVETGVVVDFEEWNSYRMVLDFAADRYYIYLNDQLLRGFDFESAGVGQFTDADILAVAAGGDSGSFSATGTAYFDNYLVFETSDASKIPEPTTLVASLIALGLAAARRR